MIKMTKIMTGSVRPGTSSMKSTPGTSSATPSSMYLFTTYTGVVGVVEV